MILFESVAVRIAERGRQLFTWIVNVASQRLGREIEAAAQSQRVLRALDGAKGKAFGAYIPHQPDKPLGRRMLLDFEFVHNKCLKVL